MTTKSTELYTGDGRKITVADVTQLYRNVVNLSTPSKGTIHKLGPTSYCIEARFQVTDCDLMENVRTQKIYSLQLNNKDNTIDNVQCQLGPNQITELASAKSNNGRYLARLNAKQNSSEASSQSASNEGAESRGQTLEIWDRSRLIKTIDIGELEAHGPIANDAKFSKMVWSRSGKQDKLLYVCHAKRPKSLSFFKEPAIKQQTDGRDEEPTDQGPSSSSAIELPSGDLTKGSSAAEAEKMQRGADYNHREDWGECLTGVEHTILAILDVSDTNNLKITTIDEEGVSLDQPVWLDGCTKVASVGYDENPRKLGLLHCSNRPNSIFVYDCKQLQQKKQKHGSVSGGRLVKKISQDGKTYHSIRANNTGDKFIYLVNRTFCAHKSSSELHIYDILNEIDRKCVVQIDDATLDDLTEPKIGNNDPANKDQFFIEDLPQNCFTSDDNNILMVTFNHLYQSMNIYNLEKKTLHKMDFPAIGVGILDFNYDIILAVGSAINTTPTMFVAKLNLKNTHDILPWHQIEDCHHLDDISYDTYTFPTSDNSSIITSILVNPAPHLGGAGESLSQKQVELSEGTTTTTKYGNNQSNPTVVVVHGGPHSNFKVTYSIKPILYARLGLKTLLINYRGSLGVDENYVNSLRGNIGKMDVDDVIQAIKCAANKKLIQLDKLIIAGGSHGGFLSCHMSCQDQINFTSAVICNPVTDIASMFSITDIPDWTFSEALGHSTYDFSRTPTNKELVEMFNCSPMSQVNKANVPTLMLLGNKDRRVPMSQGLRWYQLLKAQGVESKCKIYNDGHSLGRPETDADLFITATIWMLNHLPTKR